MINIENTEQLRILWIDDDENLVDFCSRALRNHGAVVLVASSGKEGLDIFRDNEIDVIVSDLEMGEMDGLEVAKGVDDFCAKFQKKRPKFIILTAWVKEMSPTEARTEFKVDAILEKPIEIKTLFKTLKQIVKQDLGKDVVS